MIRALYDKMMKTAGHRHTEKALAIVSFTESSFFPLPPDLLLIPMVLANRRFWWRFALVCSIASVLGALLGYAIGALAYEWIAAPLLDLYGAQEKFENLSRWYDSFGGWAILFAALTPFPYKVVTLFSGAVGFDLVTFVLISALGRSARFFIVSALLWRFGPPMRVFVEKRLNLFFAIFVLLLIGGFFASAVFLR